MTSYWSRWRLAHPEYRERERARRAVARQLWRGDRSAEYARQRERRAEQRSLTSGDNGETTAEHPLLALARAVVERIVRPDRRSTLYRPTFEDATSEAVVALLADEDAEEAARRYVRAERAWTYRTAPLLEHAGLVLLSDQDGPLISIGGD